MQREEKKWISTNVKTFEKKKNKQKKQVE